MSPHLAVVTSGAAAGASSVVGSSAPGQATAAGGVGAKGLASVAVAGGFSAGKLLVAGALVGSALTAGLGLFLLREPLALRGHARGPGGALSDESVASSTAGRRPPVKVAPRADSDEAASQGAVDVSAGEPDEIDTPPRERGDRAVARHVAKVTAKSSTVERAGVASSADNALMREAELIGQARAELVGGRPATALALLDSAKLTESHSLEPETLALRVRALRLLGREEEAARVEDSLKARFPDNFLSR